jgi:hypothetical protein
MAGNRPLSGCAKSPSRASRVYPMSLNPKVLHLESGVHHRLLLERAPMFRFDRLIRRDMLIRDVKQQYPVTRDVFAELGFRHSCDDCDIETVARKNGLDSRDVLDRLNQAAFDSKTEKDDNASN